MNFGKSNGNHNLWQVKACKSYFHMHFWHICQVSALTPSLGAWQQMKTLHLSEKQKNDKNLWHFSFLDKFSASIHIHCSRALVFICLPSFWHPCELRYDMKRNGWGVNLFAGQGAAQELRKFRVRVEVGIGFEEKGRCAIGDGKSGSLEVCSQTAICQARDCV